MRALSFTGHLVHVFEMSAEVARLRKGLMTHGAVVRPLACVLAEVIPQVAAFLEDALTPRVHAFEIQFDALGHFVFDLDGLMPLLWNALKRS